MKYTLVGTSVDFIKNSVITMYRKYRFLKAEAYSFEELQGDVIDDEPMNNNNSNNQ